MWIYKGGDVMAEKKFKKLVSLDQVCWDIIEMNSGRRGASLFVRNAIRHYDRWLKAGHKIPLVKDDTLVNRFDANTINMRTIEVEDNLEAMTKRWNDAYVENLELKKQLGSHIENAEASKKKEKKLLSKWWHIFFVGFRN